MSEYAFQNSSLPVEDRIDNLLSLLTLDEKIRCLSTDPSVPRLGVRGSGHVEGLHGVSQGGPGKWGKDHAQVTTMFPQAYGLGQTWNPELIERVAEAEGIEARYIFESKNYGPGGIVVRAPNADLGRDPRWGRTEECYGEDAFLTGTLTVHFVKGLQGKHPKYWLTASLMKHFLANSNEDGRESSSSNFDERLWREYYSNTFRRGVEEGGSRAFMAAYNAYNGVPCHIHPMLKQIAVAEWGQNGIICTDGGGYGLLVNEHKAFATLPEGAAAIIKAGIGQFLDTHEAGTKEAVEKDLLAEADIDNVLRGVFRVMIKLGLLDPADEVPYSKIAEGPEPWRSDEHKQLALETTLESIVLLKNDGPVLPLDAHMLRSIAVIGPLSDVVLGDWYGGDPPYAVTPLQGIREAVGEHVEICHAVDGPEAIEAAKGADVVIFVAGNTPASEQGWAKVDRPSDGREVVDRQSIDLEDEALLKQIYTVNPHIVFVLTTSFPFAINWSQEHIPAILEITHCSQEQGAALAQVLFGKYNPAGRLTQTWPKSLDQVPSMMDYDITNGRTYMYFQGEPLYPFGFGLSYSTFHYRAIGTSAFQLAPGEILTVSVLVKNTSGRDAQEVVQLYATFPNSKVARPNKQLVAFRRIEIPHEQSTLVTLHVTPQDFAYWSPEAHAWVVEDMEIELHAGSSSQDLPLSTKVRLCKEQE